MAKTQIYYYSQIISLVKKGQIDSAYFIYGEEVYLIDVLIKEISQQFVGKLKKEINYFLRYASDTSLEEIVALTAGASLFSRKKVVVLKDYQNMRNPNVKSVQKYMQNPSEDICLIIVANIDYIPQTKYKSLQECLTAVRTTSLRENELKTFILNEFGNYNKTISSESINTILYLVGEKINDLKTAIVQVANYFINKEKIEPADIERIVGIYVTQNIFELTRLIAQKNVGKSLFILHNLIEKGESPGTILFFLLRHLTILWKMQGFYQSGNNDKRKIQRKLNLYPKQFDQYLKELPSWQLQQLKIAIKLVDKGDQMLKSSQVPPFLVLDMLILKLMDL